jgi:hypothetical protein
MPEIFSEIQKEQAKQEEINSLISAVDAAEAYNRTHGWGALMAEALGGEIGTDDIAKRHEGAGRAALDERFHAQSLGLDFEVIDKKGMAISIDSLLSSNETKNPKELRLVINNIQVFIGFLKELAPSDLAERPEISEKIGVVMDSLVKQMDENYNPAKNEDRRWKPLLDNAPILIAEFERLGLGDRTALLEKYMINARRGTLEQFRRLKESGCFDTPESNSFGPSRWHADSNPESYEKGWKKVYDKVLGLVGDEDASELRHEAATNLIICARSAVADMEHGLSDPALNESYREWFPIFIATANKYKNLLEQLAEEPDVVRGN